MENKKLTKELIDSVRHIDGFPIGSDEDIIELSDAPYYTACPNPFINDFIKKYGTEYDEENDDYHREPFAYDISEGKTDPIYNAHSYHTKVPHKAIMRYILHYTDPGDIVFDGFCGSGMTGVAASKCGELSEIEQLEFKQKQKNIKFGKRRAVLNDVSSVATFISYNYNTPTEYDEFISSSNEIIDTIEKELNWMYETKHVVDGIEQYNIEGKVIKGEITNIVWSDVFICPNCLKELIYWDIAVDKETGEVKKEFECDSCNLELSKSKLEKKWITNIDYKTNEMIRVVDQVPVLIKYRVGNKGYTKELDSNDLSILDRINNYNIGTWYPEDELPHGYNTKQPINANGYKKVYQFYTKRNLITISRFKELCKTKKQLFVLTSILMNVTKQYKYRSNWKGSIVNGTLYIPTLNVEINAIRALKEKISYIKKVNFPKSENVIVNTGSMTDISNISNNCIDYIFIDPPFGANIMYSELNFLREAWLKVKTNNVKEAIINPEQNKGLYEYQYLMERSFEEMYRILKPGRWITIEFSNSKGSVWNSIQESILKAGFIIADVRTLDKKQGSFKQVTTTTAMKQDLIISAYKPKEGFIRKFLTNAGTEQGVWDFVKQYLEQLNKVVDYNDKIEILSSRLNYVINDRMIAFHVRNGVGIPMDSSEFYKGLKERFIERDGMYFLPEEAAVYDKAKLNKDTIEQLSLIVMDEKSAIQWLMLNLEKERQTYQQLQPSFLKELHQLKHEKLPELMDILEQNFLKDETGKWYVPDLSKQSDLEKIREKSLLKEFDEYLEGSKKLKQCRTEAVRAGFKKCWKDKKYETIVKVANRLPESVIQEDQTLLMYYDNALMRIEE